MMGRKVIWGILFIFATIVSAAQGKEATTEFTGKCVGVSGGDIITVLNPEKKRVQIRLYGIDCPEKGQSFGKNAKKFTSLAVFGKVVTVKITETDRYGQKIGTVILSDGTNLNHQLVKEGLAWWYREYATADKDIEKFEKDAKAGKKGLWADDNAITPSEWREKARAERIVRAKARAKERRAREQALKIQANKRRAEQRKIIKESKKTTTYSSGETVYITNTGKKYHRGSCRYLKKSKIKITLAEARRQYSPCKVCKPPR